MPDAAAPTTAAQTTAQMVQSHPTTSSAGLSGAMTTIVLSILLHCNIHPTIEEVVAWTTVTTAALGYALKFLSRRYPELAENVPKGASPQNPTMQTT